MVKLLVLTCKRCGKEFKSEVKREYCDMLCLGAYRIAARVL